MIMTRLPDWNACDILKDTYNGIQLHGNKMHYNLDKCINKIYIIHVKEIGIGYIWFNDEW